MIRFKNSAYIVLILVLLLSPTSVSHSVGHSNAIPLTHEGTFVYPKWTWNGGLPTKGGALSMDLNLTFDPMLVHVKLPGEILLHEEKRTIKVHGTEGHFRVQGGSTITGEVVLGFSLPSLSMFLSGKNVNVNVSRKVPISYVSYPHRSPDGKWDGKVVLNDFFLKGTRTGNAPLFWTQTGPDVLTSFTYSSGRPVLNLRAETPGHVGTGVWDTDIASAIAARLPDPYLNGSDAQSAQILANHFLDYLDVNMSFVLRVWSEYTFASETLTVNETAITDANQVVPAPNFDPTAETYQIESSYDENFTYGLNLIVKPGSASAKLVVLKDLELWSYEAQVPESHVSILPKKRYDMDFKDVSTNGKIYTSYYSPNVGFATGTSPYIIPDPSLRRAIRKELGLDPGHPRELTRADLRQLTHLSASVSSSDGLNGLEHAVNLRSLAVAGNLSDLSPVSKLKKLESLNVGPSALSEVSLSKLPNLQTLNIDRTPLTKVTLSELVSLTELQLPIGFLSELSLSKLPNLQTLNVGYNPLSKVSVSNLGSLTELEFVNHTLSELSLSNLKNLVRLSLEGSTISKLSLSNLPNLREMHQERHIGGWGPLPYEQPLDMNLSHLGISELSLSKLPHLEELDISNNHISDLSLLKGTENLTHLNLSGNAISLIFPHLGGDSHPKLIWLNLSNNLLTSGGMSAGVLLYPNLRVLDLSHNNISRLPHRLSFNTKLTHLNLANNGLSDPITLSPPRFRSLTHLKLDNNQLSELSLSGAPKNLELMSLANNPLSKVSLSDLPKLIHVDIYGTSASSYISSSLTEVSLSGLTNVTGLTLSEHPLLSKASLSDLPNLQDLNIFHNPLLPEVSMSGIPNLKYLRFSWNKNLSTLSLPELPNLTTLICVDNSLSDVSFVKELTSLTELELSDNLISDIAPLSNLINLTALGLNNNLISDIAPLSNLINLTKLRLGNNLISDIAPLSNLINLTELELRNNFISDVTPLSDLTNLTFPLFHNNPVHPESLRTYRKEMGIVFSPSSELPVLIKISGDGQIGAPGEELSEPFVVQALDENEKPMPGASIRFFVFEGEGTLSTPLPLPVSVRDVAITDVDGKAETMLTLGPNPGSNRVAAIGYDGFKAIFTATATLDAVVPPQIAEDVNGDDVVNIQDLVLVASNFGQTGEHAADVNGDGIVDILDLVMVSGRLQ